MSHSLKSLAVVIASAALLSACGSGGDDSNKSKPTGPITTSNMKNYLEVALTTLPSDDISGMPIGNYVLGNKPSNISQNGDAQMIEQRCEDGTGKVLVDSLFIGDDLDVQTQGNYTRIEYTECTFGQFEHQGVVQSSLDLYKTYTRPADSTEFTFTESQTVSTDSYEAYSITDISSGDSIYLDGALSTQMREVSTEDFVDPTVRNLSTVTDKITTTLFTVKTDRADHLPIDQTFTNFTFLENDRELQMGGHVVTKVNNKTYEYTVSMPGPLQIIAADTPSLRGEITVAAGLSTLKVKLNGQMPTTYELDVDGDNISDREGVLNK